MIETRETFTPREVKNLLDIIAMMNDYLRENTFYHKILDSLLEIFHIEKTVIFLPDENLKLTHLMGKNIEEKYLDDFKKYYHRFDPFKLIQGITHGNKIVRLEDLVTYPSFLDSEYYNDFLRPQEIFYKTVVYLKHRKDLLGIIGLFRSKGQGNFSKRDFEILRVLTPYLSQSLKNKELFKCIQIENSILKMVDKNLSSGIIIFDNSLKLVHMNQKAKDFCQMISEIGDTNKHSKQLINQKRFSKIPFILHEDCYHLKEQLKKTMNMPPLPIYKIFTLSNFRRYSICSQVISKEMNPERQLYYMIKIEELIPHVNPDIESFEMDFNLTKREGEILGYLFNGLKNSEIAEKLSISEITVKTHLQHIFEKVEVNSRTALIRKMIDYQHLRPQDQN